MKSKQGGFTVIEIAGVVCLVAIVVVAGMFIFHRYQSRSLAADQIYKKFECKRVTADVRETDVFCSNPKFYNNPSSVTLDDFYKYYACDVLMKQGLPANYSKTNDPGYYNAYNTCKNKTKLDSLRKEFIKKLEKLKAENS